MRKSPLLTIAVLVVVAGPALADVSVQPLGKLEQLSTFQRVEFRVELDTKYDNPFDPDEIAVDASFTGPEKRHVVAPAFWMKTRGQPESAYFCVRFAPSAPGAWTMTVRAKDKRAVQESAALQFNVAPGKSRGFVRRVPDNPRYFQFDSGDAFFMVGLNLAWARDGNAALYEQWFRELSSVGGNFARVWMTHPNVPTETAEAGPGRYDQRACAYYDDVLGLAERHGVYCMVTLNNYRDLRTADNWGACRWPVSPYNKANGGPAERPADFFTDPVAQKLFRRRLRYVAARWSAYTSVAFWELWNEQSYTYVDVPAAWTRDMARFLKSVDPNRHLVTTSFGNAPQREVWEMPEIDLTQEHLYPDAVDGSPVISQSAWRHREYGKPSFVAEFGISGFASDSQFDKTGVGTNLHNGLWGGMMSGAAGAASVWWWDAYVAPRDLWHAFRGAAAFSKAVDWPRRQFEPIFPPPPLRVDGVSEPETFSDAVLHAAGGWGKSHGQTLEVLPSGQAYWTLPHFLYGTEQRKWHSPTKIVVNVPPGEGGAVVVRVARVCDEAVLRVAVDGETEADFRFDARVAAPEHKKREELKPQPDEPTWKRSGPVYQAIVDKDCEVPLPPGRHTIELANVGTDWLWIEWVTLRRSKSSRYADLRVTALYDPRSGEALAWIADPSSNWRSDSEGVAPRTIGASRLSLPLTGRPDGDYDVQWWDTRNGEVSSRDRARLSAGVLSVQIPAVVRDVAMRAFPSDAAR